MKIIVLMQQLALMKKYFWNNYHFPGRCYIKSGDLNSDGAINALDFALLKKLLLGRYSNITYLLRKYI